MGARSSQRATILDVALRLMLERGVGALTIAEVADRVGVTKAAVWHHFHVKEEILSALAEPALSALEALVVCAPPPDELRASVAEVLVEHRAVMAVLLRDPGVGHASPKVGRRAEEAVAALRAALLGPRPPREARLRGAAALGAVGGALALGAADPATPALRKAVDAALATLSGPG